MLASEIIRQVSLDLNDQESGWEYAHWTYAQLESYLQEAMEMIALSLREPFTEKVVVELEAGSGWQSACDCTKIVRILGECTSDGKRVIRRLRKLTDDDDMTWTGTTMQCSWNTLDSYMISSTVDGEFMVLPGIAVSDRKKHYVLLECYIKPNVSQDGYDAPYETVAIAKQWMLYRAMAVDSENSPSIMQLAGQHQQEFHNLLQQAIQRHMLEEVANGSVRPVSDSSSE